MYSDKAVGVRGDLANYLRDIKVWIKQSDK